VGRERGMHQVGRSPGTASVHETQGGVRQEGAVSWVYLGWDLWAGYLIRAGVGHEQGYRALTSYLPPITATVALPRPPRAANEHGGEARPDRPPSASLLQAWSCLPGPGCRPSLCPLACGPGCGIVVGQMTCVPLAWDHKLWDKKKKKKRNETVADARRGKDVRKRSSGWGRSWVFAST
jgi:hypothetical protein